MAQAKVDEAKIQREFERKAELIAKIRQMKAELAQINVELVRAGANAQTVQCW